MKNKLVVFNRERVDLSNPTIAGILDHYNVFVISEANMSHCKALLKTRKYYPLSCSFFNDADENCKKIHSNDIAIYEHVDATKLEQSTSLPFLKHNREQNEKWVLWYQAPWAEESRNTHVLLKHFITSAENVLQQGDVVLVGWAENYEYAEPDLYKYRLVYKMDELCENLRDWTVHTKENETLVQELVQQGYNHEANNGSTLSNSYTPEWRTLVLERN